MLRRSHPLNEVQHQCFEGTKSVPVEHSGIWHPVDTGGREVSEGEVLGVISDYSGVVVETVTATASGFALYGLYECRRDFGDVSNRSKI